MRLALALALLAAGCLEGGDLSQQGTEEQAIRTWSSTLCGRIQTCNPAGFTLAFGQVADCMNKVVSTVPSGDLTRPSKCTDLELQTCIEDTAAYACPSFSEGLRPPSCEKC